MTAFIKSDAFPGVLLVLATLLAVIIDNSVFAGIYDQLLNTTFTVGFDEVAYISKPLVLWINDGLMALFFFYVGLEVKRELIAGSLNNVKRASLPLVGALGGLALPAIFFVATIQFSNAPTEYLNGWAIPAATDIAFAIGLLALIAIKAPPSAKIFLLALAIFDDIGAISIIAVFYTSELSIIALVVAAGATAFAFVINRLGARTFLPYALLFVVIWVAMLKSGVHATLAGVVIAMAIPLRGAGRSPGLLEPIEHDLKPWVSFLIMPVFAFANAGFSLSGFGLTALAAPISLGIFLGLVIGKPVGILGIVWIFERLGMIQRPPELSWPLMLFLAHLAGIGFTMSLFIGGLAFAEPVMIQQVRIGVIFGSLASGILAAVVWFGFCRSAVGSATES